jgi:hypothetical protein
MSWLQKQIKEIASDSVLRHYGAALALLNALTAVYWLVSYPVSQVLDPRVPPICWPFFRSCSVARVLSADTVTWFVLVLLVAAVINAALFLDKATVAAAYWLLVGLSLLKAAILLQDYRLILNQHYMAYAVTLPFLCSSDKRRISQYVIVCFYFWAGTLKLNHEWISGSGLYGRRPLGLPSSLIPASCVYVIALELIVAFGLFAQRNWIFWLAFGQLLLFHVASFWVVGFFYPLLMFLLLSIFPLARYAPASASSSNRMPVGLMALWRGAERPGTYVSITVLCVLQLVPYAFPGDVALTGEGRLFALHMFDAPLECHATMTFRQATGDKDRVSLRAQFLTARLMCDPIVYFNLARDYCNQEMNDKKHADFDLQLEARRLGRTTFHTVVSIRSFCAANPSYSMWHHNRWINGS